MFKKYFVKKIFPGIVIFLFSVLVARAGTNYISYNVSVSGQNFLIDNNAQVNGGLSVSTDSLNLGLTVGGASGAQATLNGTTTNAGLIIDTDYTINAYTPGFFWTTNNNNSTKPKAGIYLHTTSTGSQMYFGTSNNYGTGITNNALVINEAGRVGIKGLPGAFALDVNDNTASIGKSNVGKLYFGSNRYYIGDDGVNNDLQMSAPEFYVYDIVNYPLDPWRKLLRNGDTLPKGPIGPAGPDCLAGQYAADGVTPCQGPIGNNGPDCLAGQNNDITGLSCKGPKGDDSTIAGANGQGPVGDPGQNGIPTLVTFGNYCFALQGDGNMVIYKSACSAVTAATTVCYNGEDDGL